MAVTTFSINVGVIPGTDTWNFAVLVNPTAASGGSPLTNGATSATGFVTGFQKAVEAARNIIASAGHA